MSPPQPLERNFSQSSWLDLTPEEMAERRAEMRVRGAASAETLLRLLLEASQRGSSPDSRNNSGLSHSEPSQNSLDPFDAGDSGPGSPTNYPSDARFYRVIQTPTAILQAVMGQVDGWGPTYDASAPAAIQASNAIAVCASPWEGGAHSLALLADETVLAWGNNAWGQTTMPAALPAIRLTAGARHSVALTSVGQVAAWGDNRLHQTDVPPGLKDVVDVKSGLWSTLALKRDGTVAGWGDFLGCYAPPGLGPTNSCFTNCTVTGGSLTNCWLTNCTILGCALTACWCDHCNLTNCSLTGYRLWDCVTSECEWTNPPPAELTNALLPHLTNVAAIAMGPRHALALQSNGVLKAWGFNTTLWSNYLPIEVAGDLTNAVAISAGILHNQALLPDGTVRTWGLEGDGGLQIPAGLTGVSQTAAGWHYGLALRENGRMVGWGQVSCPDWMNSVGAISAGGLHAVVLRTNGLGGILFHGVNEHPYAPLGSNLTLYVLASSSLPLTYQWYRDDQPISTATNAQFTFSSLQDADEGAYYLRISTGVTAVFGPTNLVETIHPPIILSSSPGADVWLRTSGATNLSVTVNAKACLTLRARLIGYLSPFLNPKVVEVGTNLHVSVSATSLYSSCRLVLQNDAGCATSGVWHLTTCLPGVCLGSGDNSAGQVQGIIMQTNHADWVAVGAGNWHSLAVKENGTVLAWGGNDAGQTDVPAGLAHVTAVAGGGGHSLALSNGAVVAWGANSSGQSTVPTAASSNVCAIAAGGDRSLALRQDGTFVAWGEGAALPQEATNFVAAIVAGQYHSLALKSNGTVVAWGNNEFGQANVPLWVSNVAAIAAGSYYSLALMSNGTVAAWGRNDSNQVVVPSGLSNVFQITAGGDIALAVQNDGRVVAWGADRLGWTNLPPGMVQPWQIVCGNGHVLALNYSPNLNYPVSVARDLLLIYNSESDVSQNVKDYYLGHRPYVQDARALGVSVPLSLTLDGTNGTPFPWETFTNYSAYVGTLQSSVLAWYTNHPTIRPRYLVLFVDIPTRIPALYDSSYSVSLELCGSIAGLGGWVPLGTWIAMAGSHAKREINEIVDRANDSINYINKLAHFGSNYSAGQVVIGAPPVGYSNDIYFFDDQNRNYQYPNNEPSHCGNFTGPWCLGLLRAGVSPYNLQYLPENTNNWCVASNLAGYVSWGAYGYGPNWCLYGRWGQVFFGTNSGWYIMATIESYNGRRDNYGQLSNYTDWFDRRAFSNLAQNTNYETTPVGAVCYAGEPASTGLSDGTVYFQNWNVGKYFCISAWSSAYCPCFFAVGDPLVVRKSNNP